MALWLLLTLTLLPMSKAEWEVVSLLQAETFLSQPAAVRDPLKLFGKLSHRKNSELFM